MSHRRFLVAALLVCALIAPLMMADAEETNLKFLNWSPPSVPRPGLHDGLDQDTLIRLTENGTIIFFQPRANPGVFDVVVGMMVHAPAAVVWDIASDHLGACKYIPNTFDACKEVSREGNLVTMDYQTHTSVTMFTFNMNLIDRITEDPGKGWHLETIKGDLKGRELDFRLVPVDDNRTLIFLRYFGGLRSLGYTVNLALDYVPDFETPVYSSAANYHLRCYRNEAERRVGYKPPKTCPDLDYDKLDHATIARIARDQGGLVRETWEGKTIDATAFGDYDAPREKVFEVISDFENYDKFFPDSTTTVEKREGNEVILRQKINQLDVYIFSFVFDFHSRYLLDPPRGMSYDVIGGDYKESRGAMRLVPHLDGTRTLIFATARVITKEDDSLAMKIVRSGDFPFDTMANFFLMRDTINKLGAEVERRNPR